jgi:6-phosphogluconolactonase
MRSVTMTSLASLFLSAMLSMLTPSQAEELDVWLGTGGAPSKGIYHCTLNTETGKLSPSRLVAEISSPGFLAMHPQGTHLYAVGSLDNKPSVVAYRIKKRGADAELEFDSSVEIGDGGGTHLSIDQRGKMIVTAQYGGGSVAAFAVNENGSLRGRTALIDHEGGSGVVEGRQDASHAHWAGFSPDQRFVLVPDLGLDQVVVYRADVDQAQLTPAGAANAPPGAGPRHMKFHPNGKWVYVLNELNLSVSVFAYDTETADMNMLQTIPTVSKEELAREQFSSCSEIRIHPNGKFVYAANRGHDTITVFAIEPDGRLREVQNEHVRGATPRNFNLAPSGKWLLAAGQDSHTLASFAVDEATGRITYNRSVISTPTPICVLFEHE